MVLCIKKNEHIFVILLITLWLTMHPLLEITTCTDDCLRYIYHVCWYLPTWWTCSISSMSWVHEGSNRTIKIVNTSISTCCSILDRWTIGNKSLYLTRCQDSFKGWSEIIYRTKFLAFHTDKYGIYLLKHNYALRTFTDILPVYSKYHNQFRLWAVRNRFCMCIPNNLF